jgi:hypothetical protein
MEAQAMFVNLTPHNIVAVRRPIREGGDLTIPPSGSVARVATVPGSLLGYSSGVPLYSAPTPGPVEGLPEPVEGTIYIVSGFVAAHCADRTDVYSPGTGPQDGAIRENGRIVAVTRLVQAPRS